MVTDLAFAWWVPTRRRGQQETNVDRDISLDWDDAGISRPMSSMLTVSSWTSISQSFPDFSSALSLADSYRYMVWIDLDQRRRQDLDLRFQSGILRRSSSVGDVAIRWLASEG
jgi:hypothetical protein